MGSAPPAIHVQARAGVRQDPPAHDQERDAPAGVGSGEAAHPSRATAPGLEADAGAGRATADDPGTASPPPGVVPPGERVPRVEGGPAASSGVGGPSADTDEAIRQIAGAARLQVEAGYRAIDLRLEPPALGSIHLRVAMEDGVLTAYLGTETAAARQALESDSAHLRAALQASGVPVESLHIGLEMGLGHPAGQFQQRQEGAPHSLRAPQPAQRTRLYPIRSGGRSAGVDYFA